MKQWRVSIQENRCTDHRWFVLNYETEKDAREACRLLGMGLPKHIRATLQKAEMQVTQTVTWLDVT